MEPQIKSLGKMNKKGQAQ